MNKKEIVRIYLHAENGYILVSHLTHLETDTESEGAIDEPDAQAGLAD
jgi:hypothetical protein